MLSFLGLVILTFIFGVYSWCGFVQPPAFMLYVLIESLDSAGCGGAHL